MAFNILLDELPDSLDGCLVNTDFRQGLRFFAAMADKELDDAERSAIVVRLFFSEALPSDHEAIWPFIEFFVAGGVVDKTPATGARVFDFNVDAGRLYAAFLQAYRIDLREVKMHWWLFLELFRDLPDDTMLLKVIDTRGKKAPKYADEEYKAALRKAKRTFAIESGSSDAAALGDTLRAWAGR
jgi:hypothetical protein